MSEPPFTDEEIARLRAILTNDERVAWFWALVRKWAGWIAGFLAAGIAFRDDLRLLLLWIMGRS